MSGEIFSIFGVTAIERETMICTAYTKALVIESFRELLLLCHSVA